jgi:hypothetical protein
MSRAWDFSSVAAQPQRPRVGATLARNVLVACGQKWSKHALDGFHVDPTTPETDGRNWAGEA